MGGLPAAAASVFLSVPPQDGSRITITEMLKNK
jgi:hypothetical protein